MPVTQWTVDRFYNVLDTKRDLTIHSTPLPATKVMKDIRRVLFSHGSDAFVAELAVAENLKQLPKAALYRLYLEAEVYEAETEAYAEEEVRQKRELP